MELTIKFDRIFLRNRRIVILIGCILFLSNFLIVHPISIEASQYKKVLSSQSWDVQEVLTSFWRNLFENTSAGYAMYGAKPIYLGNFCQPEWLMPGSDRHREANESFLALQMLKRNFQNPTKTNCIVIKKKKEIQAKTSKH